MKERSLLFALLMLCFSLVGHAENEKNKIVIFLTEQSDTTTLLREAELFANQQERRQFVVETLKRQAETAQYELLGLLNEMEHNGMVADICPLWIVNAVSCLADSTAIRDLEQRRDVINMSLGRPQPNAAQKRMMRQACDNTLAAGVVASVCAGNIRQMQFMVPPPYNIYTPGDCPPPYLHEDQMVNAGGTSCVICVGAVNYDDNIAPFSSEGPSQWVDVPEYGDYPYTAGSATEIGLIRPDICAPGVQIKSLDCNNINGYTLMDGTSMATPLVTGTIALMLSKNRELTPAQIDQILENTAVKLTDYKSNDFGSGRLDALAAVNAVDYDALTETAHLQALVYPNPSADNFTVVCEGMTRIEVFSIDGKLLKTMELSGSQCQIEGLENGVYFVRIVSENSVITHRIVKY